MNNIDQMLAAANSQAQQFTQPQGQGQTFDHTQAQAQGQAQGQAFDHAQTQQFQGQPMAQPQVAPQAQQFHQGQAMAQPQAMGHMYAGAAQAPVMAQQQMMPQQMPVAQGMPGLPAHLQQFATPTVFTMDSMAAMGLSVEQWFKPDFQGMTIGDNDGIVKEAICEIDMTENQGFVLGMGIRYGNPAVYHFTTDGVSCQDGMPWPQAMMQALTVDPTAKPFRSVQIPMIAVQDVQDVDGKVVATLGTSLGYTTPYSGWNTWLAFHRQVAMKGLLGQRVVVKITNEPKKNAAGNKWGNLRFELLDASQS